MSVAKFLLMFFGLLMALGGGFVYYLGCQEWSWWIFPVPNPLALFQPFALVALIVGAVMFIAGLLWRRGGD